MRVVPRKRTRLEIIEAILEYLVNSGGEAPATRVATANGLAYDRLMNLVEDLQAKGILLVDSEEGRKNLRVTSRGLELLNELRRLRRVIRDFGLDF